jgi:pimeloyl-ACP methyl ester carboxylesterase
MIAIAFAALHGERVIRYCADVAFAKPDVCRRTLFRVWRRMAESMPWDDFSDHVTTQAVGARFPRQRREGTFGLVRAVIGRNDPYTVRQACIAMEEMVLLAAGAADLVTTVDDERHPRHPLPARLAPSGLGARQMAAMNAHITTHEFPNIGHADLLECPAEAVRIVSSFFRQHLD